MLEVPAKQPGPLFLPQPEGNKGSATAAAGPRDCGSSLGFPPQRNAELLPTEVFSRGRVAVLGAQVKRSCPVRSSRDRDPHGKQSVCFSVRQLHCAGALRESLITALLSLRATVVRAVEQRKWRPTCYLWELHPR